MDDTRRRMLVIAVLAAAAIALFLWDPRSRRDPPPPPAPPLAELPEPPPATPTWEPRKAALAAAKPAAGTPVPVAPTQAPPPTAPEEEPSPPASVSGTVVDGRGTPVVGAMVTVMPLSGLPNRATPGASGTTGPSGQDFQRPPSPGQNLGVTAGDVPPIPPGDWPNVSGLASSMLVPSGSDGRFHVDTIPASVVQVVAVMAGYTAARSRPITLVPGAAVTSIELVLHPTP